MKETRQRALPLHQVDSSKRIRKERQPELVRLLAELLLQALQSEGSRQNAMISRDPAKAMSAMPRKGQEREQGSKLLKCWDRN